MTMLSLFRSLLTRQLRSSRPKLVGFRLLTEELEPRYTPSGVGSISIPNITAGQIFPAGSDVTVQVAVNNDTGQDVDDAYGLNVFMSDTDNVVAINGATPPANQAGSLGDPNPILVQGNNFPDPGGDATFVPVNVLNPTILAAGSTTTQTFTFLLGSRVDPLGDPFVNPEIIVAMNINAELDSAFDPATVAIPFSASFSPVLAFPPNLANGTPGDKLSPITVQVNNDSNHTELGKTMNLTLVDPNNAGGKLSPTTAQGTVKRVNNVEQVTFTGLSISKVGTYALKAQLTDGVKGTSGTFQILNKSVTVTDAGDAPADNPSKSPDSDPTTGAVTLRSALQFVALHPDFSEIDFNISGATAPTISVLKALPSVTTPITIDGTTQTQVTIDGSGITASSNGLTVTAANAVLRGLFVTGFKGNGIVLSGGSDTVDTCVVSGNSGDGIEITGGSGDTIESSLIGTNAAGGAADKNGGDGILVENSSNNKIVSGDVISGNTGNGVHISGSGATKNIVQGAFIGTDVNGAIAIANGLGGVRIDGGASGNTVGGTSQGAGNIISGNTAAGVFLTDANTAGNVVEANSIGLNKAGSGALANATGIEVAAQAAGNTIGSTTAGAGNVISGNSGDGITLAGAIRTLVVGNFVGTTSAGTLPLGNGGNGIDLTGDSKNHAPLNNTIGGTSATYRNVIAASTAAGVVIEDKGTGNVVDGNYIGTDKNGGGLPTFGNQAGGVIIRAGASGNRIGGSSTFASSSLGGAGNVIAANGVGGILIEGQSTGSTNTTANKIQGNFIGIGPDGATARGNNGPGILINGSAAGNIVGGVGTPSGQVASLGNVISANVGDGITITGVDTTKNVVEGNFIGLDVTGSVAAGNLANGVSIEDGAAGNTVGGATTLKQGQVSGAANFITANQIGVLLRTADKNTVAGNILGTGLSGSVAGNKQNGVQIDSGASNNTVGGASNLIAGGASVGNLISNNPRGILIEGTGSTPNTANNTVSGNLIGTTLTGKGNLPNTVEGIEIAQAAGQNTIGGVSSFTKGMLTGAGNVIAGNSEDGVELTDENTSGNVLAGNFIGLDVTGAADANGRNGVIIIASADGDIIGGQNKGMGNVISGNTADGINIDGANTQQHLIQDNLIGTDVTGTKAIPNGGNGVTITDGAFLNTVGGAVVAARNIISGNTGDGVAVIGPGPAGDLLGSKPTNAIEGNFIGTDIHGLAGLGNAKNGVELSGGANGNLVGGGTGISNVIAGNLSTGIFISGASTANNTVQNNFIGLDAKGTGIPTPPAQGTANMQQFGITISNGAALNLIGGVFEDDGNYISGNVSHGIFLATAGAQNKIQGNFIGTQKDGKSALGNGGDGIRILSTSGTIIGNTLPGNGFVPNSEGPQGNTIAFNLKGVAVVSGNQNSILNNDIFANTSLGIDLSDDGANMNGSNANAGIPLPQIEEAQVLNQKGYLEYIVNGQLIAAKNTAYILQFFASPSPDPSGFGQGQVYIGSATVTTDGTGKVGYHIGLNALGVANDKAISVTATDPAGNTSEFSNTVAGSTANTKVTLGVFGSGATGGAAKVTTQVLPFQKGSGAPTGDVIFEVNDQIQETVPIQIVNGQAEATTTLEFTAPGTYTISAVYSGDGADLTPSMSFAIVNIPAVLPVVTTQPTAATVSAGSTATFTTAATGFPAPTVQWQVETLTSKTFVDLPNQTADTLSFTAQADDDGNLYRAIFTNSGGRTISKAVRLTVH